MQALFILSALFSIALAAPQLTPNNKTALVGDACTFSNGSHNCAGSLTCYAPNPRHNGGFCVVNTATQGQSCGGWPAPEIEHIQCAAGLKCTWPMQTAPGQIAPGQRGVCQPLQSISSIGGFCASSQDCGPYAYCSKGRMRLEGKCRAEPQDLGYVCGGETKATCSDGLTCVTPAVLLNTSGYCLKKTQ